MAVIMFPVIHCLQAVTNILDNPVEPVNNDTFFDCLEKVTEKSKVWELFLNFLVIVIRSFDR